MINFTRWEILNPWYCLHFPSFKKLYIYTLYIIHIICQCCHIYSNIQKKSLNSYRCRCFALSILMAFTWSHYRSMESQDSQLTQKSSTIYHAIIHHSNMIYEIIYNIIPTLFFILRNEISSIIYLVNNYKSYLQYFVHIMHNAFCTISPMWEYIHYTMYDVPIILYMNVIVINNKYVRNFVAKKKKRSCATLYIMYNVYCSNLRYYIFLL